MSSASVELQDAVLAALLEDATIYALVDSRVYDKAPEGAAFPYITFGPSDYYRDDMDCVDYRIESLQVDCWGRDAGRLWPTRKLADAVANALHYSELTLPDNAIVLIRVEAVRVFTDQDGITGHGVVTLEAEIEQR